MEDVKLRIEGMTCQHCVRAVKGRLERTPGVLLKSVDVGSAELSYDPAATNVDDIESAISDEGYTAFVTE